MAMVGASVNPQPAATAGTTAAGLNTAKAAATSSPGTWPRAEPRLQKYAGPSGSCTPLAMVPGLGPNPSATYASWHSGEKSTWPTNGSMVPRMVSGLLALIHCWARHAALVKPWTFSGSFSIVAARQKLALTGTGPPITAFQIFSSLGA